MKGITQLGYKMFIF